MLQVEVSAPRSDYCVGAFLALYVYVFLIYGRVNIYHIRVKDKTYHLSYHLSLKSGNV